MKAVEEERSVRNHPTKDVCCQGSNKYTKAAMENLVFVYFVFYLVLKCDIIEETLVADT